MPRIKREEPTDGLQNLVVPKMRSPYWKYFGFPGDANDAISSKERIFCTICHYGMNNNRNTTNLRTHLETKHPETLKNLIDSVKPVLSRSFRETKKPRHTINMPPIVACRPDEYADIVRDIQEINEVQDVSNGTAPATTIGDVMMQANLAKMIVSDLLPTSIVEGSGFRKFVSALVSTCNIPSKSEIEIEIDKLMQKILSKTQCRLKLVAESQKFSLSLEKWSNIERRNFVTISINRVTWNNARPHLSNEVYEVVELEVDELLERLNVLDLSNCAAVVTNCVDDEIRNYFWNRRIPHIRCLIEVIQSAIWDCFQLPEVIEVIETAHSVLRRHGLFSFDIHPNFWITQWNTLEYFCDMTAKSSEYANDDTLNEIFGSIQEIVEILRPLKLAVETLAMEKNPVAGLAKPLVTQLVKNHLRVCNENSSGIAEAMSAIIVRHLEEHVMGNEFLTTASFFDPRFQSSCESAELVPVRRFIDANVPIEQENDGISPTKSKFKTIQSNGLGFFFPNATPKQEVESIEMKIDIEFDKYQAETALELDKCPLNWWFERTSIYRYLKQAADSFICVPFAVDHPRIKMNWNDRIKFHNRRLSLYGSYVEKILYISLNSIKK